MKLTIAKDDIFINQNPSTKKEALQQIAAHMQKKGYVNQDYTQSIFERENQANTYLGYGVALPHGEKSSTKQTALIIMQAPKGIIWNDEGDKAYLIVALAANNNTHLQLLFQLTLALSHEQLAYFLGTKASKDEIIETLTNPQKATQRLIDPKARLIGKGNALPQRFALGSTVIFEDVQPKSHNDTASQNIKQEIQKLEKAIETAIAQLDDIYELVAKTSPAEAKIFHAHKFLLQDPSLLELVKEQIRQGHPASLSWMITIDQQVEEFKKIGINDKISDLQDIARRVYHILSNVSQDISAPQDKDFILLGKELFPSTMLKLHKLPIQGICLEKGSLNDHTAIIAQALSIPLIVGVGEGFVTQVKEGETAILDTYSGQVLISPDEKTQEQTIQLMHLHRQLEANSKEYLPKIATTVDGYHLQIYCNLYHAHRLADVLNEGAEGIGLLRTEFMYMQDYVQPSIEQQQKQLEQLTYKLHNQDLTIRIFDIGGDKPVRWLDIPQENNPYLGLRGTRLLLKEEHLSILQQQLTAIYQVAKQQQQNSDQANLRILFPMIHSFLQWKRVKAIALEVQSNLNAPKIPLGIMVEVPSIVLLADHFAKEVDFFSIGTNDLYQYTLALDRTNSALIDPYEHYNPAVLRLIDMMIKTANKHNKPISICGNLAANSKLIPILIGLNVNNISIKSSMIPAVKQAVTVISYKECAVLAQKALECSSSEEVYELCHM